MNQVTAMTALIGCLALGGCIGPAPMPPSSTGTNIGVSESESADIQAPESLATPSMLLMQDGRAQLDAGHYQAATASIERALRIDPNNPELWLTLAEIKRESGDADQASLMARKALTLAAGNRELEARAYQLIGNR